MKYQSSSKQYQLNAAHLSQAHTQSEVKMWFRTEKSYNKYILEYITNIFCDLLVLVIEALIGSILDYSSFCFQFFVEGKYN